MGIEVPEEHGRQVCRGRPLAGERLEHEDLSFADVAVVGLVVEVRGEHGQEAGGGLGEHREHRAGLAVLRPRERAHLALDDRPARADQVAEATSIALVGQHGPVVGPTEGGAEHAEELAVREKERSLVEAVASDDHLLEADDVGRFGRNPTANDRHPLWLEVNGQNGLFRFRIVNWSEYDLGFH